MQLKRKHWTDKGGEQQAPGERHAKIQRAQLSQLGVGLQAQSKPSSKPHSGQSRSSNGVVKEDGGGGLLHKAKRQQAVIEVEVAREAAVQAYRQQKQQHPGAATMQSLGKLVAQGEERMRQQPTL